MLTRISILLFVVFISCSDDGESDSFKFKDQDAMGKIANVSWTYADGYADISGENLNVTLVLAQDGEQGCDISMPDGDMVFFTVPNQTGLVKLYFNSSGGQTATIFDEEEFMNYIATKGAIEILSITDTEVQGRIDARNDGENYVNGNFTISICQL